MQRRPPHPPIEHYEGLIFTHSVRLLNLIKADERVDYDLDDIRQIYRIKTWTALVAYDPARCKTSVDRWVFFCLKNAEKDMLKRRRRQADLPLDALADGDAFMRMPRSLTVDEEAVYEDARSGDCLVPNTLNGLELRVVVLLYRGYSQLEAGRRLGIGRREMKNVARSIREKMADWKPSDVEDIRLEIPVLT